MTNVYFKKENDIILMVLCGKRWRINLCCVHHLQITKNTPPSPVRAGAGASSGCHVLAVPACLQPPQPALACPRVCLPAGYLL